MKPSELFCFKDRKNFATLFFFFRKQCILCPALRHGCPTLLYVTSIRDFFCPWNNRTRLYFWSSQSTKIGIDLSLDKSIKIGKSDLIVIDCIHQSVEIEDRLVSFDDLLPPQGAKSRRGTLVTRAYIKDSTYSSNIQSVY